MIFRMLIISIGFLSCFSLADSCKYAEENSLWNETAYKDYSNQSEIYKILDRCAINIDRRKIIYEKVLKSLSDSSALDGPKGREIFEFNRYVIKHMADKGFGEFQYLFAFLHNPYNKFWLTKHQHKDYYTYIFWSKKAASQGEPNAIYGLAKLSEGVFLTRYSDPESAYFPYLTLTPFEASAMLEIIKDVKGNQFFYSEYDYKNLLQSLNIVNNSKNTKPLLFDLSSLSKNEEYKKPIWLKGNISKDIPITMVLYPKGEVYEGYYLYDRAFKKWRTKLSIDASIKGNMMHINVFDQTKKVIEKFELTIKGKTMDRAYYVEGDWIAQDKKLPVRLADIELYDDHVTCEEMQLAPDYVFNRDIDFGVGHSSQTMEVDGYCKLGMPNLELSNSAYALAEAIRLDPPWGMGCAGSIVYVHARVESYRFMMAAYAPDVFYKKFHENYTRNKKWLDNWSKKSFYSNRVSAEFGHEIEKLKPIFNNYYKNNVEDNDVKADLYSDVSINALISYAAGSGENEDSKPSLISMYGKRLIIPT